MQLINSFGNYMVLHDQRYKLWYFHFSEEFEVSTLLDPPQLLFLMVSLANSCLICLNSAFTSSECMVPTRYLTYASYFLSSIRSD